MPVDPSTTQLPPQGAQLRLPPKNLKEPTYEEVYQQVRRHLKDDGAEATMSVQMKTQVKTIHAEPVRIGAID